MQRDKLSGWEFGRRERVDTPNDDKLSDSRSRLLQWVSMFGRVLQASLIGGNLGKVFGLVWV